MTKEPTFCGFVSRLQAKSDSEELSYMERKYKEAVERVKKRK